MMSTPANAKWDVVILADDPILTRNFVFAPNTRLVHVMEKWKSECQKAENWIFTSADRQETHDQFTTLDKIGESGPNSGTVILRVLLFKPRETPVIFGFVNDDCHHIEVEPTMNMRGSVRHLLGRPMEMEYNGDPLHPKETVDEGKLMKYAVITEPCRQTKVNVKLSNGETKIFRLPGNSFVFHLVNEVRSTFEKKDFSFVYQGRDLQCHESVRNLKHVVEVARAEFNVNIHDQNVSWTTRAEPMEFPQFLSQLAINGLLDENELGAMQFRCVGCERRISKSKGTAQLMPINCCEEKSLNLIATSPFVTETKQQRVFLKPTIQHIRNVNEHFEAFEMKNESKCDLRVHCGRMKESIKDEVQYNSIIRMIERLQRRIGEMNIRMKSLEVTTETLTGENTRFREPIQTLEQEEKSKTTIQTLEKQTRELAMIILKMKRRSGITIMALEEEKKRSAAEIKRLTASVREAGAVAPSPHPQNPVQGMNLLVAYHPDSFSPIISRSEVTEQGRYRWAAFSHIRCFIPELGAGWTAFEVVRDRLQPLFTKNTIRRISQVRRMEAVEVTSLAGDNWQRNYEDKEFSSDGRKTTWEEAAELQEISEGDKVFICNGGRRTVLDIFPS